jgi:phenylpyruvate tautomerase PptA (4-oxalocrotonate tautomerase family)
MPLVRISLQAGKPDSYRAAISEQVYQAMRETLAIPEGDRFQVITEHSAAQLVADPTFMGMQRSADFVLIQIFLSRGRTTNQKQALYRNLADRLAKSPGIPPDDVMTVLTEVGLDDWSFGRGEAQYVLHPPAWATKPDATKAHVTKPAKKSGT